MLQPVLVTRAVLGAATTAAVHRRLGAQRVAIKHNKVRQNVIDFGFGKVTGIELPGEEKGKVTSFLFNLVKDEKLIFPLCLYAYVPVFLTR